MSEAAEILTGLVAKGSGFDAPYDDIRQLQLTALNERLHSAGRFPFDTIFPASNTKLRPSWQ